MNIIDYQTQNKKREDGKMKTATDSQDAVYGTVSHSGGTWTVTFRAKLQDNGTWETSYCQGYGDFPTADYSNIPIVRNDRASRDDVIKSILGATRKVAGTVNPTQATHTLDEYLLEKIGYNIPVDNM